MSNEAALIRFPNGNIYFTGYHGCGSRINNIIFEDKAQLFIDAFVDPEEEAFSATAENYEQREAFEKERHARVYDDIVEVEIFTPYASGVLWKAKASESAMIVVDCLSEMDSDTAIEYESESNYPDWVKATGIPASSSLKPEEWSNNHIKTVSKE
jgi:hypothetical protein